MKELPLIDVPTLLKRANEAIREKGLSPLTYRTLRYWAQEGIINPPIKSGRRGKSLHPKNLELKLLSLRLLQERCGFSISDLEALHRLGNDPNGVALAIRSGVSRYGNDFIHIARRYYSSQNWDRAIDPITDIWLSEAVRKGDRILSKEEAIEVVSKKTGIPYEDIEAQELDFELPSHGAGDPQFLGSEIETWIKRMKLEALHRISLQRLRKSLRVALAALGITQKFEGVLDETLTDLLDTVDRLDEKLWDLKGLITFELRNRKLKDVFSEGRAKE